MLVRHYDLTETAYNNLKTNNEIDNNALYFVEGKIYKGNNSYSEYLSLNGGLMNDNSHIISPNGQITLTTNSQTTALTPSNIILQKDTSDILTITPISLKLQSINNNKDCVVSLTIDKGLQINDYVNINSTTFSVITKTNNKTLNIQATDTFKIINNTTVMEVTEIGIKENDVYLQDKYGVQILNAEPTTANATPNILYRYEGNLYIGNNDNTYTKLCGSNTEVELTALQNRVAALETTVANQANRIEALEEALTMCK